MSKKIDMRKYILFFIALATSTSYGAMSLAQIGTKEEGKEYYRKLEEWNRDHPGTPPPLSAQEEYEFFVKKGLPIPGSGVHIMPAREMYPEKKRSVLSIKSSVSDFKKRGYVAAQNKKATLLLSLPMMAKKDYAESNSDKLRPQSTHLRHKISDLKMAYDYRGVPESLIKKIIGFAPENTFISNGWTGAVEFFYPKDMDTVCSYHETNIQITGTSANLAKEIVRKDVNNKITIIEVSGTDVSGYAYNVEWWDDNYRHVLECASKKFSPDTTKQTIALAINIDNR